MPRHRFTDTRQRIEEAATRLFVERGITETSVRDITRAVGISEGALYRHFESKDDWCGRRSSSNYTSFARELESLAAREPTAQAESRGDDSRLLPRARRQPDAASTSSCSCSTASSRSCAETRRRR